VTPAELLIENRRRAQIAAQEIGAARLRPMLERAQRDLNDRIARAEGLRGPGKDTFTSVRARAVLAQIEDVMRALKPGMRDLIVSQAVDASDAQTASVLGYLRDAERAFTGIATPLPISHAAVLDRVRQGAESSALRRILSDPSHRGRPGVLDRYGESVIGKFEDELQQRALTGKPWAEVRAQLVKDSPFLQAAPAHWAERIVRTESLAANNRAGLEAMTSANEQLGGDMLKILCAAFDSRTASDSFAVHGQIRRVSEPFHDWTHAYMAPPNRPNDRETVVPHRIHWPVPIALRPRSDAEVSARWAAEGRKGSPPPRPKMSTVDMAALAKEEVARTEAPAPKPTPEKKPAPATADRSAVAPPATPSARTPRFRNEQARAEHASRRLFDIPRDDALSIPGSDVVRHPLRTRSGEIDQARPWGDGATAQRVLNLARELRELEKTGSAPPLRQIRIDQIVALDPDVFRSNVLEAIRQERHGTGSAPILVRHGGTLYAQENAEAIIAAHLGERRTVQARIIDLDAKKPWPTPPKKAPPPQVEESSSRIPVELVTKDHAAHVEASGISVYDRTKFNAAASNVFAQGMPTIDTLQKTWGSTEAGHTIKITGVSAYGGDQVMFSGAIMAGGRNIGSVTRTFKKHANGTFEVHHDLFKIEDPKEQGKKGGSTMLRQAIQTYEKIGVHEVTVDTAWVGRYAWATFGYNWDADTAEYRERNLTRYLASKGVEAKRAAAIAKGAAPRAWDVAALDVDGITVNIESEGRRIDCKLGKAFMLDYGGPGSGQGWSGKIVLDPKHETYQRAKERIGL